MGFFSKDRKKPSIQIHPGRSANKLGPALAPQDPVEDRRYSHQYGQPPTNSTSQSTHILPLSRSQSKRQSNSARDRPTVNVVSEERLERSSSLRPSSGILESIYYRGKTSSNPSSQPESPRVSHQRVLNPTDEYPPDTQHSYSENPSPGTAPQSSEPRAACQQRGPLPSHPAHTQDNSQLSQQNQNPVNSSCYTQPLTLRTENSAAEITPQTTHSSATDIPASLNQEIHRGFTTQEPVSNSRPSSRTHEPLSPIQSNHPDAPQPQTQAQSDTQSAASPQQARARGGSVSNMPENGRGTPTAIHHREDPGELEFRVLLQKHEELRKATSFLLILLVFVFETMLTLFRDEIL